MRKDDLILSRNHENQEHDRFQEVHEAWPSNTTSQSHEVTYF